MASLPVIDLESVPISSLKVASAMVSPWFADEFGLLAVDLSSDCLSVAVMDARGLEGSKVLEAVSGKRVRLVTATPGVITAAQQVVYGDHLNNQVSNGLRYLAQRPEGLLSSRFNESTADTGQTRSTRSHSESAWTGSPHALKARMPLGQRLRRHERLSPGQLDEALRIHQQTGSRIGDVLVHWGLASDEHVADALAEQGRIPRTDLLKLTPEPSALARVPQEVARRLRVVPISLRDNTLHLAVDGPLAASALSELHTYTDSRIWPVLGTRAALDTLSSRTYAHEDERVAAGALLNRTPDESAYVVLTRRQRYSLGGFLALVLVGLLVSPLNTLIALNLAVGAVYLACSIYKFKIVYNALGHSLELPVTQEDIASLDDRDLPIYTILVPLYREAAVVSNLVQAIAGLDYPRSKLDIKLITEADDSETRDALEQMELPAHFKILTIPDGLPKTKPKACNFGLLQAEGEYVVIYDAEDRPEPDQLKKVVSAFSKADDNIVCIQCKLNFYNRDQNLLTRWFSLEYSTWFDLFMPGLDAAGCPIPLGGTSNHLNRMRLLELGAWDPFNVTEDCDLGIRLHKANYKTAIVDSTTFEEANSDLNNWIRQRSRWVKGYVQTWLVHMRHPARLMRQIGLRSWLSLQLVLAGTFIGFFVNPIFWALNTAWILTHAGVIREAFPASVYYASVIGLYVGNFSFVYVNVAGALRRRYPDLVKYALLSPLYWGLMSVGAWKGLLQLCTRPHYWEKTVHGLDSQTGHTVP